MPPLRTRQIMARQTLSGDHPGWDITVTAIIDDVCDPSV